MLAVIEWLTEQGGGRRVLPTGEGPMPYVPIIRFVDEPWPGEVAWSTAIWKVEASQDPERWRAEVTYRVDDAPHDAFREGREFELYEGRRCVARGSLIAASAAPTALRRGVATA